MACLLKGLQSKAFPRVRAALSQRGPRPPSISTAPEGGAFLLRGGGGTGPLQLAGFSLVSYCKTLGRSVNSPLGP